jgi:AraC-like DNA-binding protein
MTPPSVPQAQVSEFRFSSEDFPERDRIEAWQDVFERSVAKAEITVSDDTPLRLEATAQLLPGLNVVSMRQESGLLIRQPRESASVASDDIGLTFAEQGTLAIARRDSQVVVSGRDTVAATLSSIRQVATTPDTRCAVIRFPRSVFASTVHDLDASCGRLLPAEPMALLRHYLGGLRDGSVAGSQALQRVFVTHVTDLVTLALGATRDAAELAKGRGIRAARLRAIKNDILANLRSSDLSLDTLARRHRISPRYIRMLFAGEETSFSDFVSSQRLARAHRMLTSPRFAASTISAIAYDAGFGDLSHFNHAFRRRYGATPSGVRAQARHPERGQGQPNS